MAGDYEKNKITCIEAIKYLKQYTVEHFAQEEAFQLKVGCRRLRRMAFRSYNA